MRKVVHFEIPVDDVERAKSFYGSVFDWDLNTMPVGEGEYTIATTTPVDDSMMPTERGAINGGLMERSTTPRRRSSRSRSTTSSSR